jgi:hypothetical protein
MSTNLAILIARIRHWFEVYGKWIFFWCSVFMIISLIFGLGYIIGLERQIPIVIEQCGGGFLLE